MTIPIMKLLDFSITIAQNYVVLDAVNVLMEIVLDVFIDMSIIRHLLCANCVGKTVRNVQTPTLINVLVVSRDLTWIVPLKLASLALKPV